MYKLLLTYSNVVLRLVSDTSLTTSPDAEDFLTLPSSLRWTSTTPSRSDVYGQCQSFSIPPAPLFTSNYNQYASNTSGLDIAEFCIWNGQEGQPIAEHVYTQRAIEEDIFNGRVEAESLPKWMNRWPHLAECNDRESPVQGSVLLVKSHLTLPPLGQVLDANSLKTHLAVTIQDACISEISVITRIYTMGQKVLELTNFVVPSANEKLYIPFAQEFWSAFLQGLRNLQGETSESRPAHEAKTVIGGISVIQELWSENATRRVGFLCWEFDLDEDQKQSISIKQFILPGQQQTSPTYETSPTYFPAAEATPSPFLAAPPPDFSTYPAPPSFPTTFHSSPFTSYNGSTHLHPFAANLQRHSVSPMPTLEQATSPLIMRPSSAPIGINPAPPTYEDEIVDTGVVLPTMVPAQGGLGISGLGQQAWL